MASFDNFKCIKNIALKSDFNNYEIIDSIQILIKNWIMMMECRALIFSPLKTNTWKQRIMIVH
jgi:hypothetical protein